MYLEDSSYRNKSWTLGLHLVQKSLIKIYGHGQDPQPLLSKLWYLTNLTFLCYSSIRSVAQIQIM